MVFDKIIQINIKDNVGNRVYWVEVIMKTMDSDHDTIWKHWNFLLFFYLRTELLSVK